MHKNIACIVIWTLCTDIYGQEMIPSKYDFFDAVTCSNILNLKYFIAMNVDINSQDNNGNTALHIAFKSHETKNSNKVIEILLKAGIDKSIKNNMGEVAYKKTTYFKKLLYRFNNSLHKKSYQKDNHNLFAAEEFSLKYPQSKKNRLP